MSKEVKENSCRVIERNVTEQDIAEILGTQQNTTTENERLGENDAFELALEGSKVFLKEHGYIED